MHHEDPPCLTRPARSDVLNVANFGGTLSMIDMFGRQHWSSSSLHHRTLWTYTRICIRGKTA
eukprot:1308528-Amphidinium_carterae.1